MRARLLTLVVILLASSLPALALGPGGTFTDDNNNSHEGYIEAIAAIGVTNGCGTDPMRYCPSDEVTRAEMASFLARALELPPGVTDHFTDDDGNVHEANINAVADAGVTLGVGAGRYDPSGLVNRAQMASFLARALDLAESETDHFADDDGDLHEPSINSVADEGITLGCGGSSYCPKTAVRRDQMATFIGRALELEEIEVPAGWPTDGSTLTEDEARTLFSLYFEPGDVETAVRVADCESNFDPTAVNPSGLHGGLFQHAISAWDSRASQAGWAGASIFDPEANTAVSAWLVEVDGWWHWSCY